MRYIVYNTQNAHGVRVIVDNLVSILKSKGYNALEMNSLSECSNDDFIIPYGVKECYEVAKMGFRRKFGLLVDAISLGYRNKILFYLRNRRVFTYDFFYSIYGYLRYSWMEKRVVKRYENLMLVSPVDIDYLRNRVNNSNCKYHYIPNGAYFVTDLKKLNKPEQVLQCLTLGVLSPWVSRQTFQESYWFFKTIFPKYIKEHNGIKIIIAGRGQRINAFRKMKNVEVLGEVKELSSFFNSIDVFMALSPKGCGILNRVLDAITYRVPVAGLSASFSGFPNSQNAFASFDNYESFCHVIEDLKQPSFRQEIEQNAYIYAQKNNSWEDNYMKLADIIVNMK